MTWTLPSHLAALEALFDGIPYTTGVDHRQASQNFAICKDINFATACASVLERDAVQSLYECLVWTWLCNQTRWDNTILRAGIGV